MAGWLDIGGALITAGANLLGSRESTSGTERGAAINEQAIREGEGRALEALGGGKKAGLRDIDASLAAALRSLEPLVQSGQAGYQVLRKEAVADPSMLTPSQRKALEDAQLDARNQLATTGLRGAGRTQARILSEVTDRFRNRAMEDNLARRNAAADRLFGAGVTGATAGSGAQLTSGAARAGINTGTAGREASEIGANARAIGGVNANAAQQVGETQGQAIVDTGRVFGETLGTIADRIAEENKRKSTVGDVAKRV